MYSWLESTFENQVFCRRALQILIFCHYLSCTSHFPPVAIPPCQQCALSHQVRRALLFMFLIFLITSCTSSYATSGILSINHFTVTCANLIMAFHLPPYRQQTKMHWLHIWKQTSMLVFQHDFFFSNVYKPFSILCSFPLLSRFLLTCPVGMQSTMFFIKLLAVSLERLLLTLSRHILSC